MLSLEAISGFKLEIDNVQNIIKDYTRLANSGKTIILCWIPSHVNIRAMRGLTLQKNQLFRCPLQIWSFQHVNFYHASQQTSNWSFSSHLLIFIDGWWLPNLSILWNSTYSKTHISGMCQLPGHSWKILHLDLSCRLI